MHTYRRGVGTCSVSVSAVTRPALQSRPLIPGLPATLLTSFGPPLINMAIFSLIYPFFVVQAMQSRPPSASLLPGAGTPTSGASTPTKETHSFHSPILGSGAPIGGRAHVPIFFFARNALKGLRWVAEAGARERGGGTHERALGRRY